MKATLQQKLPLLTTAAIFIALYVTAGALYDGFFSPRVLINLFADNAFLGIVAVGMTLVIFAGGIDLSVGAVVGCASILVATLIQQRGWHPLPAGALVLALGALFGAGMGALIHRFKLPAFLITLAGMFLARGSGFWISTESIGITHEAFTGLTHVQVPLGGRLFLPLTAMTLIGVLVIGGVLAHYTRFGRNLLAVGANEQSALLMGLPVGPARIWSYTLNGLFAALGGLVATLYTGSGNASLGLGLELDAIAVVVIGGTLLSGGRGHILGTLLGLLIFGTIRSAMDFDGRFDSAWLRIVVGALLLGFILLQRLLARGRAR